MKATQPPNQLIYGFIGAGNMASAMIRGLVSKGHSAQNIIAANPTPAKLDQLASDLAIKVTEHNQTVCDSADVVIIAVKPQKMAAALANLHWHNVTCVISVAAGTSVNTIAKLTGQQLPIIRAMPNTPAMVLEAATGVYADTPTKTAMFDIVDYFFSAFGQYQWIDDEEAMDVVTAIAGSSPAYFFRIFESMIQRAEQLGLPSDTARQLVVQSCLGAAVLTQQSPDVSIEQLRQNVTSPNGTTAAALASLEQDNIMEVIGRAVSAAVKRGHELSQLS